MQIISSSIHKLLHAHAYAFGVFVAIFSFVFFAGGLVAANGQSVGPSDSHVVNLYVDGSQQIVPTRAATVEELLNKTGVTLKQDDLVEPALKSEITDDNFNVHVYRAQPVTIIDGNTTTRVMTPYDSPALIADKAGIKTYPEDDLAFSVSDSFVTEQILGQKLTINRATPTTISLYGAPAAPYRTHAKTVGDLLKEKNITPESGATLTPSAETALTPNMPIFISKYGKQVVSAEEPIAFTTESTADPSQPLGKITVTSAGKNGKKQVVYELELRDGKEIGRRVIQEVVSEPAVAQKQLKGTKNVTVTGDKLEWMRAAGIADSDFTAVDFVIGHESHWRPGALNGSGCAGLGQACPGSKLAKACPQWQTDPVCQLRFFTGYANRYGGWQGASQAWISQGWW